ncbi:MAG: hypothetical protein WAT88_20045 [Saprospiraceae bacterium]
MTYKTFSLWICLTMLSCQPAALKGPVVAKSAGFDEYWYQNKAEITAYDLNQARYGEMRQGEAILIFVTEELSKSKQVKLDNTSILPENKVPVLKMNMTKRFDTGLYPYNIMLSSFVAAGGVAPWQAIKIAASVTEWCGQVYAQLNLNNDHYRYQLHSYFESDGEKDMHLNRHMTEDAIWSLIRLNPDALIQSDSIMVIPGLVYSRLSHKALQPYRAKTRLLSIDNGNKVYQLEYPELQRSLYIEYESTFPYQIIKWSEEYKEGFGDQARVLTTTAVKKKQLMIDYWNKHGIADDSLRALLDWHNLVIDSTDSSHGN